PSPHRGRPDPRRCAPGDAARAGVAETLGRRRQPRTPPLLPGVDRAAARGRHRHRTAPPAHPPQRPHRRTGLPALLHPAPGTVADPGRRRGTALAHRGILPGRQGPHRPRSTPGPPLGLLAPLDHPGHARPRLPSRGHRRRTRHPTHPDRSDHVDRQRIPAPLRCPAPRRQTHPGHPARLVHLAPKTPTPSPPIPLPTTGKPMITNYGCSTSRLRFPISRPIVGRSRRPPGPGPTAEVSCSASIDVPVAPRLGTTAVTFDAAMSTNR